MVSIKIYNGFKDKREVDISPEFQQVLALKQQQRQKEQAKNPVKKK